MTDIYTQENGSKKKFLAPVLVILLCMVSLTAAGYAYSATVDNTGDHTDVTGVSMSLTIGGVDVTAALYDFDVTRGTHTVNGQAVFYNGGYGFKDSGLDTYTKPNVPTGFKTGYYVESDIVPVAEKVVAYDGDYLAAIRTAAGISSDAQIATSAVYKVGGDYTLQVINKSGVAIALKVGTDAANLTIDGVKLVAVFDGELADTVIALDGLATPAQVGANIAADAITTTYTLSVYAVSVDYYWATAAVLDTTSYDFALNFSAAAAA